jgi:hypothetical protein
MASPLYTSTAIQYLNSIIQPSWRVFEFGSGNSTQYYKDNCAEVHALEHDASWGNMLPEQIIMIAKDSQPLAAAAAAESEFFNSNFDLPRHPTSDIETEYHGMENWAWRGYASQLWNWPKGYFDVVVVDGMARSLCLYYAAQCVKQDGYIILDNSCRWQYNDLQEHVINQGWNRKDFWQPDHPGWCTSFFSSSYAPTELPIRRPRDVGDLYHSIGW